MEYIGHSQKGSTDYMELLKGQDIARINECCSDPGRWS